MFSDTAEAVVVLLYIEAPSLCLSEGGEDVELTASSHLFTLPLLPFWAVCSVCRWTIASWEILIPPMLFTRDSSKSIKLLEVLLPSAEV